MTLNRTTTPPAAVSAAVPLSRLPGERRAIPGFPRYFLSADRTAWSDRYSNGKLVPLATCHTTAGRAYVMLQYGRKLHVLFIETLFRRIFPELAPRAGCKAAVEYQPLPGWPGYRVGSDRSVWVDKTRRNLPPPWNRPRWQRLKARSVSGHGAFVVLRFEGTEYTRSVELLSRAAFADPSHQFGWTQRIGPPAVEPPALPSTSPSCPATHDQAEVMPAIAAAEAPPVVSAAEYRPIPGFANYRLGSDRTVTLCVASDCESRLVPIQRDESGRETALLRGNGRSYRCALDDLVSATFPESAPSVSDGRDPALEYLSVPGFPRYHVGSDNSVWAVGSNALRAKLGLPLLWHRLAVIAKPGRPSVGLNRDGKRYVRYISDLRREAFACTLPTGPVCSIVAARGSAHGRSRLNEEKVSEARRLKAEGWTTERLAKRFGVAPNTIGYALSGATWSHVPMIPESAVRGGQSS